MARKKVPLTVKEMVELLRINAQIKKLNAWQKRLDRRQQKLMAERMSLHMAWRKVGAQFIRSAKKRNLASVRELERELAKKPRRKK
ncbi:MAG TPA: hypothetical protein VEI57_02240 [Nitrospirota bacterium]|nr:hypothetical protein [Nitrospirota bacterium]